LGAACRLCVENVAGREGDTTAAVRHAGRVFAVWHLCQWSISRGWRTHFALKLAGLLVPLGAALLSVEMLARITPCVSRLMADEDEDEDEDSMRAAECAFWFGTMHYSMDDERLLMLFRSGVLSTAVALLRQHAPADASAQWWATYGENIDTNDLKVSLVLVSIYLFVQNVRVVPPDAVSICGQLASQQVGILKTYHAANAGSRTWQPVMEIYCCATVVAKMVEVEVMRSIAVGLECTEALLYVIAQRDTAAWKSIHPMSTAPASTAIVLLHGREEAGVALPQVTSHGW
jgi:hypothetical protein